MVIFNYSTVELGYGNTCLVNTFQGVEIKSLSVTDGYMSLKMWFVLSCIMYICLSLRVLGVVVARAHSMWANINDSLLDRDPEKEKKG